jgi:hypothetical protein
MTGSGVIRRDFVSERRNTLRYSALLAIDRVDTALRAFAHRTLL